MQTTIFCAPDLHKRDVDFTSIRGYREAIECVQQDILEFLQQTENSVFISLGDWYDKGYRSTSRVFIDSYYDDQISKAVNGEAYICLGNHFFLERDSNPEMYLIQPSYLYQPKDKVPMSTPTFKTVPHIVIGNVQISFFHYNKNDKNYVEPLEPGVKYHIGIYHDDCIVPSDIRQMAGYYGTTSNDYLNNIYSNVDVAIVGHIHSTIGMRIYTLNSGREVPIFVPGALSITENKDIVKHKSVMCPVIIVDDEKGTFELSSKEISTHMDLLKFYKVAEQKISETMELLGGGESELVTPKAFSLVDFLKNRNYSERDVNFIMNIQPGTLDITTLIKHMVEEAEECHQMN